MKTHVLYHANCYDGFAAAYIAHSSAQVDPEASYHPVKYNEPVPKIEDGSKVLILDFSYPRDVLLALHDRCESVLVLDHHKTAEQDLTGLGFAIFDQEHSGCVMTWRHFYPDDPIPRFLKYIEDRDLWLWQQPNSHAINAAIRTHGLDFAAWDSLWATPIDMLLKEGFGILRGEEMAIKRACDNAAIIPHGKNRIAAVNSSCLQSEIGHELCNRHPDTDYAMVYFDDLTTGKRVYSLRSVGDFDVSEVAKAGGGGGHKNAAGFTEPMPEIL